MSNYAIIIGVDQYENVISLPSCENDARLMEGLLAATGKYQILRIPNNSTKYQVQEKISTFLPSDQSDVNEVLFYFSGHGQQDAHGMHYALFNTDINKINSTSLNNTELDDIIRKVSPKLYVKIIDACQSGVAYIKGVDTSVAEPASIATKGFENCIFLYSSLKTQSSFAGDPYSKFTKAIIDAIENISAPFVKFIDIQNYLSDVFHAEGNEQTPYFSTQCDGTEVFCEKTPDVLSFLNMLHPENVQIQDEPHDEVNAINSYIGKCRGEAAVKALMQQVQEEIEGWTSKSKIISEFYDWEFSTDFPYIYHKFHENESLLKFIDDRADKENLFVEVEYESDKGENPFIGSILSGYYSVPKSYRSLANQLPSVYSLHLKARNANLPDYVIPFVFIYSPTFFYSFTCTIQFVRKGWKDYEAGKQTKYVCTKFEYHDFSVNSWKDYQSKRTDNAIEFVEKTLLEYIGIK